MKTLFQCVDELVQEIGNQDISGRKLDLYVVKYLIRTGVMNPPFKMIKELSDAVEKRLDERNSQTPNSITK